MVPFRFHDKHALMPDSSPQRTIVTSSALFPAIVSTCAHLSSEGSLDIVGILELSLLVLVLAAVALVVHLLTAICFELVRRRSIRT